MKFISSYWFLIVLFLSPGIASSSLKMINPQREVPASINNILVFISFFSLIMLFVAFINRGRDKGK